MIATKGGLRRTGPGEWPRDARPERLKECCEGSLRRLRVDRIDLYQLHAPDPEVPYADSVGALKELQDEGKIRHIGVSNVSTEELAEAREIVEVVTVQNRFNLEDRSSEDVLEVCARGGHRVHSLVPPRHRQARPSGRAPGRGGRRPRRISGAGGAGVAPGARGRDAAHPRHLVGGASRGERGRGRPAAGRRTSWSASAAGLIRTAPRCPASARSSTPSGEVPPSAWGWRRSCCW